VRHSPRKIVRCKVLPIRRVFRPDDPDAITVLRLTAAANDLGTMLRMVFGASKRTKWTTAEANGAYRYAFRMGALHLDAIKKIVKRDLPAVVERFGRQRGFANLQTDAEDLQRMLAEPRISQVIAMARHGFAGHYDRERFVEALRLVDDGDLMEIPGRGVHHNACDRLFDVLLANVSHREFAHTDMLESVTSALHAALDIQMKLFPIVQALVVAMSKEGLGL
jgi:hypothetical protein